MTSFIEDIHFTFCDIKKPLCREWEKALDKYLLPNQQVNFTVFDDTLDAYTDTFDCIVSPANSIAQLTGSFDAVISRMFETDIAFRRLGLVTVTSHCQSYLHATYNGYLSPGMSLIVPMHEFHEPKFQCRYIALCPTMRLPDDCRWNKEVVYNGMWNLLCEILRHNRTHPDDQIKSVFMTGLGTGVGGFPVETCAAQMILAYKHFMQNLAKPRPVTTWTDGNILGMEIDETVYMGMPDLMSNDDESEQSVNITDENADGTKTDGKKEKWFVKNLGVLNSMFSRRKSSDEGIVGGGQENMESVETKHDNSNVSVTR